MHTLVGVKIRFVTTEWAFIAVDICVYGVGCSRIIEMVFFTKASSESIDRALDLLNHSEQKYALSTTLPIFFNFKRLLLFEYCPNLELKHIDTLPHTPATYL